MAGRPRLNTPERRQNILTSKAKWRDANREYYRLQKRLHANLPECKARRRELREQTRHTNVVRPAPTPENPAPTPHECTLWAWYNAHATVPPEAPRMHFKDPS